MKRRVVITGVGTVSALGKGLDALWDAALEGRTGIGIISCFDPSEYKSHLGAEARHLDLTDRLVQKLAKKADPFARFAMWAADVAMEQSGLVIDDDNKADVGVIIGSGIGGMTTWETQFERLIKRGPGRVSPFLIPMMIPDMASGLVSIQTGAMGPNLTAVTACASGVHSMAVAIDMILLGRARAFITGGAEAGISQSALAGFCSAGALSVRNDDPTHACRPFDRDRDGFIMGEGATCMVVEDLEHALERGVPILAEVIGMGLSGDAHHITEPTQDGEGAALAMRKALDDAEITPGDIDYINAHGPGTPAGDTGEANAVASVFADVLDQVPISSTKPVHGHMLGATGSTELALCMKVIETGIIPHTLNCDNPDEAAAPLNLVRGEPLEASVTRAMSNSFGFGGHNISVIISKYED